jgi:hypothetical protein
MLKDDCLAPTERLSAIYILLEFGRSNDQCFVSALNEVTEQSSSIAERVLLQEWLTGRDLGGYSVSQMLNMKGDFKDLDIHKKTRVVRPLVNAAGWSKDNSDILGKYEAEFLRPTPDLLDVRPSEVKWVTPGFIPSVLWDIDLIDILHEARGVLSTALTRTLSPKLIIGLRETLDTYPQIIDNLGLRPDQLNSLIDHNSEVAGDLLIRMSSHSQITDFFHALMGSKLSLPSIELMNRLINEMDLPSDITIIYITNSMKACSHIRDSSKQVRTVRLLCAMIQSLLASKFFVGSDLRDLAEFCNTYHNVREANELSRVIRSYP